MFSGWWGSGSTEPQDVSYDELPTPSQIEEYEKIAKEAKEGLLKLVKGGEEEGWIVLDFSSTLEDGHQDILLWENTKIVDVAGVVRATGLIKASPQEVFNIIAVFTFEERKKFDKELADFSVVKDVSSNIKVLRTLMNAPSPLAQREFITLSSWDFTPDIGGVYFGVSVNYPYKTPSSIVRGVAKAMWLIVPVPGQPNQCMLTRMGQIDPKGMVPTFMVNLGKTKPANDIIEIRKILNK